MSYFFKLYRKKGVNETLDVLSSYKGQCAKQSEFFQTLKDRESYLNSFFRVKDELLKYKLIAYRLDDENEKVIYITDKGKELYARILEIEKIITEELAKQ
jgi:predicted transcriptional regulator